MENQPYTQILNQVNGLPSNDRANFLSQLPKSLLSDDDKKHLATTSLDATKDGAKVDVITQSVQTLPKEDKQTVSDKSS